MKRITTSFVILILAVMLNHCADKPLETPKNEYYTKSIERIAENEFEQGLIEKAEAAYPPRDSVLDAVRSAEKEDVPETGYWWYSGFDGIYMPYAITIDAIEYYENFIDSLATNERGDFYKTANLQYKAHVSFHDSFKVYEEGAADPSPDQLLASYENVYVVEMTLDFTYECFRHCFLLTEPRRVVIFDSEGELLEILYDGPQLVVVA